MATIKPYKPNTSAKIKIKIIPTKSRGCWAVPRTPASPTIPIAKPAANPLNPTANPAPKCKNPLKRAIISINYPVFQGQAICEIHLPYLYKLYFSGTSKEPAIKTATTNP